MTSPRPYPQEVVRRIGVGSGRLACDELRCRSLPWSLCHAKGYGTAFNSRPKPQGSSRRSSRGWTGCGAAAVGQVSQPALRPVEIDAPPINAHIARNGHG